MVNYRERLEDYELDLKDLLYRIVMKWRQMLVAFLIVGALFGVVSGVKSYQNVKNAETALAEQKKHGGPKEGEQLVVVPELRIINVASIVLGGVVGVFGIAMMPTCSYILSSKLRHKDDLNGIYSLHLIASYPNYQRLCNKRSKMDNCLYKVFWRNKYNITDKEQVNVAVSDCAMSMAKNGYKSICFISSVLDKSDHVTDIINNLSQIVDTWVLEKPIFSSAQSLQCIQKYDCVVIVEKIDQSYYEDIAKELDYCDRFNVPVVGYLVYG